VAGPRRFIVRARPADHPSRPAGSASSPRPGRTRRAERTPEPQVDEGRGAQAGYAGGMTTQDPGEPPVSQKRSKAAPESGPVERESPRRDRDARRREPPQGMVPGRERRRTKVERGAMRVIATGGIIGIAVVLGAVLVGQDVAGWIVGLVVGLTSVILAALLWSSRQL
jgi:hypothetical protein